MTKQTDNPEHCIERMYDEIEEILFSGNTVKLKEALKTYLRMSYTIGAESARDWRGKRNQWRDSLPSRKYIKKEPNNEKSANTQGQKTIGRSNSTFKPITVH
jgi:hypothetical protein